MSPLRMRMIEDMTLAGLAAGTQVTYIDAVRKLAGYYRRPPDQLTAEEVRAYILRLRQGGAARGTYYGIQYFYRRLFRLFRISRKQQPEISTGIDGTVDALGRLVEPTLAAGIGSVAVDKDGHYVGIVFVAEAHGPNHTKAASVKDILHYRS
jgi:Phage integrase, N-terminal SAM-like domain